MPQAPTAILVLGMHRSGTSSLAGALSILGASAPRTLMRPADDNPKGFWESEVLTSFNDRLLSAGDSSWHDWRVFDTASIGSRIEDLKAEAKNLVAAEFGDASTLVLKDPRICRLLPFWREVLDSLGYRIVCISPLRAPAEVAASLMARNDMSRCHALRLWMRHVMDGEHFSRDLDRAILPWTSLLADWRGNLVPVLQRLEVPFVLTPEVENQMDQFLTADLKHQDSDEAVPNWVADTYHHLLGLVEMGEALEHLTALGHLRNGFNAAEPLFLDAPT